MVSVWIVLPLLLAAFASGVAVEARATVRQIEAFHEGMEEDRRG